MTPAEIAAAQFAQRRKWLASELAARRISAEDAEARLLPWLHLAAMAGAQIPAVFEDHVTIFPFDRAGDRVRSPMVLSLSQDQRQAALAELAAARDAAIAVSVTQPDRAAQARALDQLARHLGAPPTPRQYAAVATGALAFVAALYALAEVVARTANPFA